MPLHDSNPAPPSVGQKDRVHQALEQYGVADARVTLLRRGDNTVYRVSAVSGETFTLRLHTAVRRRPRPLSSELDWLDHLSRVARLPVPQPRRSITGTWVVNLEVGQDTFPLCTLLSWMEGESLAEGSSFNLQQASQAGELLAQLHLQAEQFIPPKHFERPRYDVPYFRECWAELESSLLPHIPTERLTMFRSALYRMSVSLDDMEGMAGGSGLIHADAHPGNFLLRDAGLGLLDFDRCGWGPFLLDVAGATLALESPEREALMAGYRRTRPLPAAHEKPLKALRILASVENLAYLARRPNELPFVLEALPLIEEVLSQVDV